MTMSQSVVLSGEETTTTTLCERPLALEKDVLRRRIYAPLAYAPVRNAAVVPAVHSECLSLASWFPLVWRRQGSALEFVAIRALLNDQRAQPPAARTLLPMILHGYPFVFDPDLPTRSQSRKMLDDVFADAPTDVGATITTVNHRLSRATMSRFQTLDRFAHDMSVTATVSEALDALDAFEPWALKFNIDGHTVEIPGLLVIRPALFDGGALAPLLQQLGMPCAQMLSLHRISLFRAGILLVMAKAFLKATHDQALVPERAADMEPPPTVPDVHLQPASA